MHPRRREERRRCQGRVRGVSRGLSRRRADRGGFDRGVDKPGHGRRRTSASCEAAGRRERAAPRMQRSAWQREAPPWSSPRLKARPSPAHAPELAAGKSSPARVLARASPSRQRPSRPQPLQRLAPQPGAQNPRDRRRFRRRVVRIELGDKQLSALVARLGRSEHRGGEGLAERAPRERLEERRLRACKEQQARRVGAVEGQRRRLQQPEGSARTELLLQASFHLRTCADRLVFT